MVEGRLRGVVSPQTSTCYLVFGSERFSTFKCHSHQRESSVRKDSTDRLEWGRILHMGDYCSIQVQLSHMTLRN